MKINVLIPKNHLAQNGINNPDEFCLSILNALQDKYPKANVEVNMKKHGSKPYVHQTAGSTTEAHAVINAKTELYASPVWGTIHTQLKEGYMTFNTYPDGTIVGMVDGNPVMETNKLPFDSEILQEIANVYQCGLDNGHMTGVKATQSRMRDVLGMEG